MTESGVVIVGGGLAGLAAAVALTSRGVGVTLLESRPRLGGRASSIIDQETGQTIDNCQHVAMGCCTNFLHFCETIGCSDLLERERELYFIGPPQSGKRPPCVTFRGAALPAPLHLASSLAAMPWLTLWDKIKLGFALRSMARQPANAPDESCAKWLQRQHQSPAACEYFWHTVLVSALSESLDRISVRHARKVFVDGFLMNRNGWEVTVPRVPLAEIYDDRLMSWLRERGSDVRLKAGVKKLVEAADGRIGLVELRSGERISGAEFILAVPQNLVAIVVPDSLAAHEQVRRLDRIETAPIASVHLWFDRPLTEFPHAVLLGRLSQWVFNRGSTERGHYLQVVISAAFELATQTESDIVQRVSAELISVWPEAAEAKLLYGRLITEHRAVFSPQPGVDGLRPPQQSPIANLQWAGDWTLTGWPATMEGAVRSGYLAAENVLRRLGRSEQLLQPNLPTEWLARWLYQHR
jgi:squalene-associated FAD-dependent desaturase